MATWHVNATFSAPASCVVACKVSNLLWQDGEAEEKAKDPGAAVALGAALLVRLLVPAWVVNATMLPISAIVLPHVRPPAPNATQPKVCTCGHLKCVFQNHVLLYCLTIVTGQMLPWLTLCRLKQHLVKGSAAPMP